MKSTNSTLVLPMLSYESEDGREMLEQFTLRFALAKDDWEYFKTHIMPEIEKANPSDYADGLLCMLTYGIHKAYESIEGVEYKYHYEREKHYS